MTVRKHNIETLKRVIAAHNFHTRDFLLTAGRVCPPKRERLRRRIAQLMFRCGLSAHDLHHDEAAAATVSRPLLAVGKMENGNGIRTTEKQR
jgi:hypothetical protein